MTRGVTAVVFFLLAGGATGATAATCSISASSVVFGSYVGSTLQITGTINVKCTANADYSVGLDAGSGAGATVTNRSMSGPGSSLLSYGLFSDASYSANWGNTSGTGWVPRIGNGNSQAFTVYAQVPANQNAVAGSFTDTITATVYYGTSTISTTFLVTGTNAKACAILANSLNFGSYSGALINSTSIISITCTNTTAYNVGLDAGTASGATVTNRSMTGPASALLGYKLFRDSARSLNWGNTVGTDTVAGTGTGIIQSLTVYGQLPAGQFANPGSYADTITATITY